MHHVLINTKPLVRVIRDGESNENLQNLLNHETRGEQFSEQEPLS